MLSISHLLWFASQFLQGKYACSVHGNKQFTVCSKCNFLDKKRTEFCAMNGVATCQSDKNVDIALEVYDFIKNIKDPEKEQTLEDLDVVREDLVTVKGTESDHYIIGVEFVPTVPHCSLATLIGLCIRVKLLKNLDLNYKLDIFVSKDYHETAEETNRQINDKERIAAAMENPDLINIVNNCIKEEE